MFGFKIQLQVILNASYVIKLFLIVNHAPKLFYNDNYNRRDKKSMFNFQHININECIYFSF